MYVNEKLNYRGSIPSRPQVNKELPRNWRLFCFAMSAIGYFFFFAGKKPKKKIELFWHQTMEKKINYFSLIA